METKIKESVAVLLAHIIKKDKRNITKEAPLFCSIVGADFGCSHEEASFLLENTLKSDYNLEEHLDIINHACCNDKLSKMHLLEQINHIIYSDKITPQDYEEFEYIKNRLFSNEV